MKLTTKNVMMFLKKSSPCKQGMKALDKLLKQKQSMEFVFNKMNDMRRNELEVSYAAWMCGIMRTELHRNGVSFPTSLYMPTFKNFKILFEKLP